MSILGIDIGATKIGFALLEKENILEKDKIPTPKTKEKIIKVLEEKIELFNFQQQSEIKKIGIGAPGPLDQDRNIILAPPNLPGLEKCALGKIIKEDLELEVEVKMENDGSCFALAETLWGAAKDSSVVLGITLGTGVGGGVIFRTEEKKGYRIWTGAFGSGGEVGHMIIRQGGEKCSCGNLGCFEVYGSEKFFKRRNLSPRETAERAREGDKEAIQVFEEYGENLGIGISSLINVLDPETVVLGGGISNAFDLFSKSLVAQARKRILSPYSQKSVKIRKGKLGEFSGAIGAALLFKI